MNVDQSALVATCWQRGRLKYKLRAHQKPIYETVWNGIEQKSDKTYVVSCSRQFGKSFTLLLIATEFAIRNAGSRIRFACPTGKQLKKIVKDNALTLFSDCPKEFMPEYREQDAIYRFDNGSEIHLAGTDGKNFENLRGTMSHLNVLDEAGFMDDLDTVLYSILSPQLKSTDGINVVVSTPSETKEHPYFNIYHSAKEKGTFKQFNVYDDKSITPEQIDAFAADYPDGGKNSARWKREWLCEWATDENITVIPDFDKTVHVAEHPRDEYYHFYHKYVAMDIGFQDYTAILFGYYDFKNATVVIQDEITASGPDVITDVISERIKKMEIDLWGEDGSVYRRVSDNNDPRYLAEFRTRHAMSFVGVQKDALMAMVNQTRLLFREKRIVIEPNCKMTIGCCEHALWERNKDSINKRNMFRHSDTYKHYDHLAALIYFIRSVDYHTNPVPETYHHTFQTHVNPYVKQQHNRSAEALKRALTPRSARIK